MDPDQPAQANPGRHILSQGNRGIERKIHMRRKLSVRISRVDTLRSVHNVGFLVGRLICRYYHSYNINANRLSLMLL